MSEQDGFGWVLETGMGLDRWQRRLEKHPPKTGEDVERQLVVVCDTRAALGVLLDEGCLSLQQFGSLRATLIEMDSFLKDLRSALSEHNGEDPVLPSVEIYRSVRHELALLQRHAGDQPAKAPELLLALVRAKLVLHQNEPISDLHVQHVTELIEIEKALTELAEQGIVEKRRSLECIVLVEQMRLIVLAEAP